jgi:hypothetical protein
VHCAAIGQRAQPPPQSTSISCPLRTPSVQLGAWQQRATPAPQPPARQTWLWQSPSPLQARPVAQSSQRPPQSTSLSLAFATASVQVGALQHCGTPGAQPPGLHTPLWQSAPAPQLRPGAQSGQGPPQSTSTSSAFFTPSVQLGGAQRPLPPHTALAQSAPSLHALPSAQPGHSPPPQSVSSSAPLRTPSPHETAAQRELLAGHNKPALQSASARHSCPARHVLPHTPPQSMSVSSGPKAPSSQLGAGGGAISSGSGHSLPRQPPASVLGSAGV